MVFLQIMFTQQCIMRPRVKSSVSIGAYVTVITIPDQEFCTKNIFYNLNI